MTKGTFSVVTPNYNMARFLPETIESVLANLQPGDEYFIMDGGSTDGSGEIIERYTSHLAGWVSEPDNGYAEALAKGFRRCTGDFLCWVNSGDLLMKGALLAARQALTETGADLIFGDDLYVDERSRVILHSCGHVHSLKNMMLYGGWTLLQDACFWRRAMYERVGGIDPELKHAADYDFFLRASLTGKCLYVPKIFSAFRRHAEQRSISGSAQYEIEREFSRKRMIARLGVPRLQQVALESLYWFAVRWRFHVARRFHLTWVRSGTPVSQLTASH